jgi:hypothetical protein
VKGVHSLGSAGCGEERELEDWNCCGSRTLGFGAMRVWRVDNQWDGSPCGLIASAQGGLLLRENEQQCLWLGGSSFICSQLVNH